MSTENGNWQQLCEAASKEQDPGRLMVLVSELIKALDERAIPEKRCYSKAPQYRNTPMRNARH